MEPNIILFASGCSIAFLASLPADFKHSDYDNLTLKGGMAVAIMALVWALNKLMAKLEQKDIKLEQKDLLHKEEITRITQAYAQDSQKREEGYLNAQNILAEKIEGMTFSINKMNNHYDEFIKNSSETVFRKGLQSVSGSNS